MESKTSGAHHWIWRLCTLLDDKHESEHLDALMDGDMQEHAQSRYEPLPMEQVEEQEKDLIHRVERVIRVPEGTSAYQAAWMDSEEEESEEYSSDDDQEMDIGDGVGMKTASENDDEDEEMLLRRILNQN